MPEERSTFVMTAAFLALALAAAPAATAETEETAAAPRFVEYQLVLLVRPPDRPELPAERVAEIQRQHLAHMERQWHEGRLLVAGPFGDQADESLRGLALYDVGSVEEARRIAEADPAVQAGRLAVQVVTWYVEEGTLAFPKSPPPPADPEPAAGADDAAPDPDRR